MTQIVSRHRLQPLLQLCISTHASLTNFDVGNNVPTNGCAKQRSTTHNQLHTPWAQILTTSWSRSVIHASLPRVLVISLRRGGLQKASQRRCVTPLVLFWNLSATKQHTPGNNSKHVHCVLIAQACCGYKSCMPGMRNCNVWLQYQTQQKPMNCAGTDAGA
jgi:hypothetical protein